MSAQPSPTSQKKPTRRRWRDSSLAYVLIAPTVAVLLALSVYPLIYAVKVAFQSGTGESTRSAPAWSESPGAEGA